MKYVKLGTLLLVAVALLLVMTSVLAIQLPPGPILCGCVCPDGSFVIVHAPDPQSCPLACANACGAES